MDVSIGLLLFVVIVLVIVTASGLAVGARRDDLLFRAAKARRDLLPLMDDALYQAIKIWRKRFPEGQGYTLGNGTSEADRLYRSLCWIGITLHQKQELIELAGKIGSKFDVIIRLPEIY